MKKKKHPRDMTSDELMKHLFHPKVVEHLRKAIQEVNEKAERKDRRAKLTKA